MPLKPKTYYIWNWDSKSLEVLDQLPAVTEPNKFPEEDASAGKRLDALLKTQGVVKVFDKNFKQMPIFVVDSWRKDKCEVARIIHEEYISDIWAPEGQLLSEYFIPFNENSN